MLKKTLATALLVCSIPAMANAWFLSTQAKSAGGTITTRNKSLQAVGNGIIFKSYTTSANMDVTVTAATGYKIKSVTLGSTVLASSGTSYTTPLPGSYSNKTLAATFAADAYPVTAGIVGGTVTPSAVGNIVENYKLVKPLTFTFSPKAGYSIDAVTGAPVGAVQVPAALPAAVNQKVTVTLPAGYVFHAGFALSATTVNTTPSVNAIPAQTIVAGSPVTFAAIVNNITDPVYTWKYISGPANTTVVNPQNAAQLTTVPGPAVTVTYPAANKVSFTPPTAGRYVFEVTVGTYKALATANVVATSADAANQCQFCHAANGIADQTIGARYQASIHGQSTHSACISCHVGTGSGAHPGTVSDNSVNNRTFVTTSNTVVGPYGPVANGAVFCTACHAGQYAAPHALTGLVTTCSGCHTPTSAGDAHSIMEATCTGCHAVGRNAGAAFVQDNNGVRAITGEFTKWSHHVTGTALNDAHCAACHLEGKVEGGKIVADFAVHMVDNKTHLRNADTDADYVWDPAAPSHSNMDNFCMSCHDDNGATSAMSLQIQAFINSNGIAAAGKTASPSNPFGDTISNRYDKMQRPAVVDAKSQFATGNASHHAVIGPKYSGRTRAAGARQIANAAAFAANSSATLWGKRSTIYDNINAKTGASMPFEAFNSLYVPLSDAGGEASPRTGSASLGDDSTLHCGDCHTVGQFKPNATVNAAGQPVATVIGAHGSNNEYLLRNTTGADERHAQKAYTKNAAGNFFYTNPNVAALVCYNCHTFNRYGSVSHAGESTGHCQSQGNTLTFKGYTTGTATDGTQFESRIEGNNGNMSTVDAFAPGFPLNEANRPATGELKFDNGGNAFGIQCANCHNSGVDGGYGGIHGSTVSTYTDGMGNVNKKRRFLPGLGNAMYVPGTLGGFTGGTTAGPITNSVVYTYTTGGTSADTNWEQVAAAQALPGAAQVKIGAGCYTLYNPTVAPNAPTVSPMMKGVSVDGGATQPDAFGTWGACEDHGPQQGGANYGHTKLINRPVTY